MSIDIRLGHWQERLRDVPDASVRLLLTSPPYDNARTYEGTQTEPVDFDELARFALRVLMPGGVLAMVLDGPIIDGAQSVTPFRVICEWAALQGWKFAQCAAYGRAGVPGTYPMFRKDHEPLILFVRDGARHVHHPDRIASRAKYSAKGKSGRRGNGSVAHIASGVEERSGVKLPGSILDYGVVSSWTDGSPVTGHPATFAERFALDAVKVWSNPGDLVCDPFSGAGTVAKACRDLGRSFVGAERVPLYHEMSLRRLDPTHISEERAAEPVGPLFGAKEPTR